MTTPEVDRGHQKVYNKEIGTGMMLLTGGINLIIMIIGLIVVKIIN